MEVFEFHFNPKAREDLIFDSFCYEPENIYEKRLGSFFIVGELRNVFPQNLKFLENLASFLRARYYSAPIRLSPEVSLKESLKKLNEFLEGILKSGNVSWLGNLNLAVLSLIPKSKNYWEIILTKVGTVKTLLLRRGQIVDIGKNLEFSEIEPYPLKIFSNIVSGKLIEGDIIMVLTNEVFSAFCQGSAISPGQKTNKIKNFFQKGSLFEEIIKITSQVLNLNKPGTIIGKKLGEIFKREEKNLLKISGVCLFCILTAKILPKEEKSEIFTFQKKATEFSIKNAFLPLLNWLKKLTPLFLRKFEKINEVIFNLREKVLKIGWPKLKLRIKKPKIRISKNLKKNLILILFLIIFLFLGFLIAKKEEGERLKKYQLILDRIEEKSFRSESLLILNKEVEANALLKEAWKEILPLIKIDTILPSDFKKEVFSLKNSLEERLYQLNKLEIIEEPELFFEFEIGKFLPKKMAIISQNLYFYNPLSQNLFKVTKERIEKFIQTDQKFNLATSFDDSFFFFSKPDKLINFKEDKFFESFSLKIPYPDFDPSDLSSFKGNLYFLDSKSGQIIKYSQPLAEGVAPQFWLNQATKKAKDAKSLAIDGSIWILNKDNSIDRYYAGNLQETLKLDFFPFPKNFTKIFTLPDLPYLYLLEADQNRIVILNKRGEIVKQFRSEKFNNLSDFALSLDGKTIYLLNGLKVYQLLITK